MQDINSPTDNAYAPTPICPSPPFIFVLFTLKHDFWRGKQKNVAELCLAW